jgi:hypothetical protein
MDERRPVAALTALLTLMAAAPAAAQINGAALVASPDRPTFSPAFRPRAPEFRMPEGDLRQVGEPRRNGLIAAVPLNRNVQVGVGRFRVSEIAQPRTHTETARDPATVGLRQRNIAGIGVSFRFD